MPSPRVAIPVDDAPTLEYAAPGPAAIERRWLRAVFLIGSLPLAVAPFFPFTYGVSPIAAVVELFLIARDGEWRDAQWLICLAADFFLAIPILVWRLRLLVSLDARHFERVVLNVAATVSMASTLAFMLSRVILCLNEGISLEEFLTPFSASCGVMFGGGAVWWNLRRRITANESTSLFLITAYLSNATLSLIAFDNRDYGQWLVVSGGIVMVVESAWIVITSARRGDTVLR